MELEYDDTLARLRRIAATDPNKRMDMASGECQYGTDPEYGEPQPMCLVGHLLYEVLPPKTWIDIVVGWNKTRIDVLFRRIGILGLVADPKTRLLLSTVQSGQDNGQPWWHAVENAVRHVEDLVVVR